ncbi:MULTISPECIES: zinc ribbon domain-containing protein [unclassified Methanoregula]|uniref:zinc ribbon domain-containing protein n=1 Tax=unclassified Methanoregula TaxID=2649730 RepID=UPI0009CE270A|nr:MULTISPECIES: zinc ribbon domain-containing protein [unclassified Methanoregula]OPX63046.1 MAG: hypothetical protein A4E33_01916 [Methanoregula sp. PtaB.Bin085]OPY32321.1 MAG: hypothetical protein A4E34_02696 [Methanoregula sp. PtaU1.Bin006]
MAHEIMSPGQKALEDRFELIKNRPVDPEKNPAEQFGEMEAWTFSLGDYRFFLNPMTKRWYFFDRPHNSWKDINAPAGSVIFSLRGSEIEIVKAGAATTPSPSAATKETPLRKFCPQCGAPLRPGLKFCSSCGAKIS